jgi:hypothetical protein
MTIPLNSTHDRSAKSASRDPFLALANAIERNPFWADSSGKWELPPEENQRRRKVRVHPPPLPDALRTPAEAARKLRCSIKTLDGYVKAGALKYVALGHGKRRQRRRFTDADLNEFIANQTRKDAPCPSTRTRARRTGNLTSSGEVIAFTARPRQRTSAKPKR